MFLAVFGDTLPRRVTRPASSLIYLIIINVIAEYILYSRSSVVHVSTLVAKEYQNVVFVFTKFLLKAYPDKTCVSF